MPTVITDKTDLASIEEILKKFNDETDVDIYSSKMSPIDQAIAMGKLKISNLDIQFENDKLLFVLSNGTIINRKISDIPGLSSASKKQIQSFENMGNGILWHDIPHVDMSLKHLLEEELLQKYNLKIA